MAASYLQFWAKTERRADGTLSWHAVPYHLLDVAAVAGRLLDERPRLLSAGAELLGLAPDDTRRFVVALAALHDIGKFSRHFQAKAAECYPAALGAYRPPKMGALHTVDGSTLWYAALRSEVGSRLWAGEHDALDVLMPAVFGHHGSPAHYDADLLHAELLERHMSAGGVAAACACVRDLFELLDVSPVTPAQSARPGRATWWLSGVTTLADWLGSQSDVFRFNEGTSRLSDYWALAQQRAQFVVARSGLVPARSEVLHSFTSLTGGSWQPTAVQQLAETAALPDGPLLFVIEDVTGAGKTEAAQMLVHRLVSAARATGAYWAMPTQATANAMYARQEGALARLFDRHGPEPSLVLAHGQSRLHERFRSTIMAGSADAERHGPSGAARDLEVPSGVSCAAFLADDKRVAMLASIGAGTIDQAVQGVLPSRFNALRLIGLAEKVLILDEVHAYDAYLGQEALRLLEFQAALGGHAIVLSATLSSKQWNELLDAWRSGAGGKPRRRFRIGAAAPSAPVTREPAFPLVTVVHRAADTVQVRQHPADPAPHSRRRVALRRLSRLEDAIDEVVDAASRGEAVAWIRNTVDSCLDAAARLRALGVESMVFHARFAQGDRQRREAEVVECFGRPDASRPDRERMRQGRVLLATQVVEQSLDLDFDVMVTDLAPMDLLIQRAGRLWRHPARDAARRARGLACELLVLSPGVSEPPSPTWPNDLLPGTGSVYHAVQTLWRTARLVERVGAIATPGAPDDPAGLRNLIGAVFDSDDLDDIPETLHPRVARSDGDASVGRSMANYHLLHVDEGYDNGRIGSSREIRPPTRLTDGQTVVRLGRVLPSGAIEPWFGEPADPLFLRWALSEVRLRLSRVPVGARHQPRFDRAVAEARAGVGAWEQEIPILPLELANGETWKGELRTPNGAAVHAWYCRERGVQWAPPTA